MDAYEKIHTDTLDKVRAAIAKVTNGELYDSKGFVTKEGYEALEILEGLNLFWICDPAIKLVNKSVNKSVNKKEEG